MRIRIERGEDFEGVRRLHLASFSSADEADLVERLRATGDAEISLVAEDEGQVVGHVMFSRMNAPFKALGLAPVAVQAEQRRRGIAARLIEEGVKRARETGWEAVFVLGEPGYYGRFGFSAELAEPFDCAYAGPYLMALFLQGDELPARSGTVSYAPAFAGLA